LVLPSRNQAADMEQTVEKERKLRSVGKSIFGAFFPAKK
jgi:hypothetical protein